MRRAQSGRPLHRGFPRRTRFHRRFLIKNKMPAQLKPAAFLDRDGVINSYVYNPEFGTVDSPSHPDQFELKPGAAKAIAMLNRLDLPVIVVSNQSGIAKRKFSAELLQAITEKMRAGDRGCRRTTRRCLLLPASSAIRARRISPPVLLSEARARAAV